MRSGYKSITGHSRRTDPSSHGRGTARRVNQNVSGDSGSSSLPGDLDSPGPRVAIRAGDDAAEDDFCPTRCCAVAQDLVEAPAFDEVALSIPATYEVIDVLSAGPGSSDPERRARDGVTTLQDVM
jgi:hypothetical protein